MATVYLTPSVWGPIDEYIDLDIIVGMGFLEPDLDGKLCIGNKDRSKCYIPVHDEARLSNPKFAAKHAYLSIISDGVYKHFIIDFIGKRPAVFIATHGRAVMQEDDLAAHEVNVYIKTRQLNGSKRVKHIMRKFGESL